MTGAAEQRKSARIAVALKGRVRTDSARHKALTENLSTGGAMLTVDEDHELSAGQNVVVELEVPAPIGETISLDATVRWASEMLPDLIGVEFSTPLSGALAEWLAALVAESEAREQG